MYFNCTSYFLLIETRRQKVFLTTSVLLVRDFNCNDSLAGFMSLIEVKLNSNGHYGYRNYRAILNTLP